jgi:hypothetical protein
VGFLTYKLIDANSIKEKLSINDSISKSWVLPRDVYWEENSRAKYKAPDDLSRDSNMSLVTKRVSRTSGRNEK